MGRKSLQGRVAGLVGTIGVAVAVIVTVIVAGTGGDEQMDYCSLPAAERGPFHPDATRYGGAGPHPVRVLLTRTTAKKGDPTGDFPSDWLAGSDSQARLVACEVGYSPAPRETCQYWGATVYHLMRRHEFHVIEAASGRELGRFAVDSVSIPCRHTVPRSADGAESGPGPVDGPGLQVALRPYVEGLNGVDPGGR